MLIVMVAVCGCSEKKGRGMGRELAGECYEAAMEKDYGRCDALADSLLRVARAEGDQEGIVNGLYYKGLYDFKPENAAQRRPYMMQALEKAEALDAPALLCKIYNALAFYEVACYHRYAEAHKYFTLALAEASRTGDRRMQIVAETNLSELYRVSGDTMALRYDQDIYRYATERADTALIHSAAFHLAKYYIKKPSQAASAIPYINSVEQCGDFALSNALWGEYYLAADSVEEAQKRLDQALASNPDYSDGYLLYANLLNKKGEYLRSLQYLERAKTLSDSIDPFSSTPIEANRIASLDYQGLGDFAQALLYQRAYAEGRDSILAMRNQAELNRYKIEYETHKKEAEIDHQIQLRRQQGWLFLTIIVALILITIAILWHQRRQQRLYRSIVAQNRDFIEREKTTAPAAAPGPSDQKADEIYASIVEELEQRHIYRDVTVTRDSFAERVGCNHTYFTQVIRERFNMSYLQLMNSYRMREALKILSTEPAPGAEPITMQQLAKDLGFLSVSTFYSTFKAQVGMSPAMYRQTLRKLPPTAEDNE
ncbi:MAG: helix-turn-helix domain-containing protein [Bacteroidales bacterium]|nr:helix-turn-helix domain-containing protein [Bacteroidales bacterium]